MLLAGLGVTVLMAALYVWQPFFVTLLDNKVYDSLLRLTHHRASSGSVVIVDLDERSLARFGQWPWPRYRMAYLLEKVRRLGAASVGVDIVFAEPDRTSPRIIQQDLLHDLSLSVDFTGLPEGLMDYDRVMANILSNGPFVLSYNISPKAR